MRALCGSFGSSSPYAFPASVSYWPADPKDAPSKAGDTFFSMTIFFTDARAVVEVSKTAMTKQRTPVAVRFTSVCFQAERYFMYFPIIGASSLFVCSGTNSGLVMIAAASASLQAQVRAAGN
jgi:hypothetical protein